MFVVIPVLVIPVIGLELLALVKNKSRVFCISCCAEFLTLSFFSCSDNINILPRTIIGIASAAILFNII